MPGRKAIAYQDLGVDLTDSPEFVRYSLELLKPYGGSLLLLTLATIGQTLLNGASQVALTPLLEIVLSSGQAPEVSPPETLALSFDLNSIGASILTMVGRITGVSDPWKLLVISSLTYLMLVSIGQITGFGLRNWAARMRMEMARHVEYRVFGHILRLPLGFLNKRQVGWLQSRMSTDVGAAMTLLNDIVINGLSGALLSIFYILLLVRTDIRLTLVAAAAGMAQLALSRSLTNVARNRTRDDVEATAMLSAFRQERLSSLRDIKALAAEQFEQDQLLEQGLKQVYYAVRRQIYKNVEAPIRFVVNRIVIIIVMLFGAWQMLNGHLSTSAFLLFMFFAQSLTGPLTNVASIYLNAVEVRALLGGVAYLLSTPAEPSGSRMPPAGGFSDTVQFSDVSFAYEDMGVLRNVNLTIRRGQMVALVGRSGAGKSTLVNLLLRFYQPTSGEILMDGVPITEFDVRQYRRQFGVVSQDALLFNDTVYGNIAYARPELTREDVERAARIANAEGFILRDLPAGYDTVLGERGVRLSGGQRQRIAIARAIAHRPSLLILDEATSALDSESERQVQEAIAQVVQHCTSVVIAHRLSTILMADQIIVLKDGEIVERGTHQELYEQGGEYRYLYDLQFNVPELEPSESARA